MAAPRLPLFLLAFALTAASFAWPAQAEVKQPSWKTDGAWAQLFLYAGSDDYEAVLKDSKVKAATKDILKGQTVDLAKEFGVRAPIGLENDCLILKGGTSQKTDTNRAYMEVCLAQGNVNLGIYDAGKITIYSQFNDYQYMSESFHQWIYLQSRIDAALMVKPDNVEFATPTKK